MKEMPNSATTTESSCQKSDRLLLIECHEILRSVDRSLKILVRYLPKTLRGRSGKTTLSGTRLLQFEKATSLRRIHPDWSLFKVCRKAVSVIDGPDGYDNPASLQRYMGGHGIK